MGKKGGKGNPKTNGGGTNAKEDREHLIMLIRQATGLTFAAAAAKHKLSINSSTSGGSSSSHQKQHNSSSSSNIICGWCQGKRISSDKKTIKEHIESKNHRLAKGDLITEGDADQSDSDGDQGTTSGTNSKPILEHPQLTGVILDYLPFAAQMACYLTGNKKIKTSVHDALLEGAIDDLVCLFQPHKDTVEQGKLNRKHYLEGKRVDESEDQHHRRLRSNRDCTVKKASDASLRLCWALSDVVRRSHREPQVVEYWIDRLKRTCFVPIVSNQGGGENLLRAGESSGSSSSTYTTNNGVNPERLLVLPESMRPPLASADKGSNQVSNHWSHGKVVDGVKFKWSNGLGEDVSSRVCFGHLSSPRRSDSITVVPHHFLTVPPTKVINFLKDVRHVDILLQRRSFFSDGALDFRRDMYENDWVDGGTKGPLRRLESMMIRNVSGVTFLSGGFLVGCKTIQKLTLVGGQDNSGLRPPLSDVKMFQNGDQQRIRG